MSGGRATQDLEAQRLHAEGAKRSIYQHIMQALQRPTRAAIIATATVSLVSVAVPQVALALWGMTPTYQLAAACACFAASFALTYAADWVQLSVSSAIVGAAFAAAFCPGPVGVRLLGGAVAGAVGAKAAHWLYEHWHFLLLGGGVLAALMVLDAVRSKQASTMPLLDAASI